MGLVARHADYGSLLMTLIGGYIRQMAEASTTLAAASFRVLRVFDLALAWYTISKRSLQRTCTN